MARNVKPVDDKTIYRWISDGQLYYITAILEGSDQVFIEHKDLVESNSAFIMSEVGGRWVKRRFLEIA